jgi:D-aminopeptidase
MLPNEQLTPLFEATVQAVEESIVNALFAAETMTGFQGRTIEALPVARTLEILREHKRVGQ